MYFVFLRTKNKNGTESLNSAYDDTFSKQKQKVRTRTVFAISSTHIRLSKSFTLTNYRTFSHDSRKICFTHFCICFCLFWICLLEIIPNNLIGDRQHTKMASMILLLTWQCVVLRIHRTKPVKKQFYQYLIIALLSFITVRLALQMQWLWQSEVYKVSRASQ